jgi:hypothetical protein
MSSTESSSTSRFPAPNGGNKWLGVFKLLINSQVGGWVAACLIVLFMMWWVSRDRNLVYQDLWRLRKEAIDQLASLKVMAEENKTIAQQNKAIGEQNNELIKQLLNRAHFGDWGGRHQEITQPPVKSTPTTPQ